MARPNYGRFDPGTFTLPDSNWPSQLPEQCCACGDPCTGNVTLPVYADATVADDNFSDKHRPTRKQPACKMCRHVWDYSGYWGPDGLDEYLRGERRQRILNAREYQRHLGPGYYRVISDRTYRFSREGTFADRWALANVNMSVLRQMMVLPCSMDDKGAWQDRSGKISTDTTDRWRSAAVRPLTDRECAIAASAIQWLGTNVGWCWLEETLEESGWELRRTTKEA